MKPHIINETIFGPEQKNELVKILEKNKIEQIMAYNWHYLVYLQNKTENQVIIHQSTNNLQLFDFKKSSFLNLIEEGALSSDSKKLIACTLFPIYFKKELLNNKREFSDVKLPKMINDVLSIGNGYLLYYHQLEILKSLLTNCSHVESFSFRRDWNLKKEYTREVSSKILITENYSLLDLILERTLSADSFVYQCNFYGTNCLTNYLESK